MLFDSEYKASHHLDDGLNDIDILTFYIDLSIRRIRGFFRKFRISNKKKLKKFSCGKSVKIMYKKNISFGNNVSLGDYVEIQGLSKEGISFGNNINLGRGTIIRGTGSMDMLGKGFVCGDNFGCGDNCFFGCSGGIKFGNDCILGQNIRMHSQNHQFGKKTELIRKQGTVSRGITIGNNCWIGSGAVFLDGVHIGNGVVVGANTLVNHDVCDNAVVVGNPMRIVRVRDNEINDRE